MKIMALMLCLLFLIAPFSVFAVTAEPESRYPSGTTTERIVLGEVMTGTWCYWCRYAEQAYDKLANDSAYFDTRFVMIEWHNGDAYAISATDTRMSYYAGTGYPTAVFDGKDKMSGAASDGGTPANYTAGTLAAYKQKIDARPATSPAFLDIDAHVSGNTLTAWVNTTLLQDTTKTKLKLWAVLIEDENIWAGPYPIRMTARSVLFTTDVAISKKGETGRGTGQVTLSGSWDVDKLRVVGFLQADSDKEVMQAGINYLTINNAPVISGAAPTVTFNEDSSDSSIHLNTLFTDPESDPITYYGALGSTHLNVSVDGSKVVTITPWANWFGSEQISLTVADTVNCPSDVKVTVTVNPVNDAPKTIKTLSSVTMMEGATKKDVFNIMSNFADIDDQVLTYSSGGSTNVTATIKGTGLVSLVSPVGFNGKDMITFTATDAGGLKATVTCNITVSDVNFPPTKIKAIPDVTMAEDSTSSTIKLSEYFGDIDTPELTYTFSGNENINIVVAPDTTVTMTPKADWNGISTITVTVSDTVNKEITDEFIVTVTAVNDAPLLSGLSFESAKVDEDKDYTTEKKVDTLFKDVDSTMTYSIEGGDSSLTITLTDDLTVTFHPAPNYFGSQQYKIKAFDGQYTVVYNATVSFDPVNDQPVIDTFAPQTLSQNINEGQTVDFNAVASDIDAGDVLTYKWTSNGNFVGTNSGSYKFETDNNSTGTYTIKVVVSDGALEASKTWTIKVKDVNRIPTVSITAPAATDTFKSDTAITFTAAGLDLDGDTLSYSWSMDGQSIGTGATISYKVPAGSHVIKVTTLDGKGGSASAQMTITVKNMKKTTGGTNGMASSMLPIILIVIVVVVIVVLVIALKMKGKKKDTAAPPADNVAQVPPPPPQSLQGMDPNQYQGYEPVQYQQPPPQ